MNARSTDQPAGDATSGAPLRIAVIVASEGRYGPLITEWFSQLASTREDFKLDVISLPKANLPTWLPDGPDDSIASFEARLDEADAFVIVTPEYNHSFPAGVKHAIDLTRDCWGGKPVAMIAYGGRSGGLRAVEPLRPVLATLGAVTIANTVSFHVVQDQFDEDGQPVDPAGLNTAGVALLDELTWWAQPLRTARANRPYPSMW